MNYAASPATGGTVALRQRLFGRGGTMPPDRLAARRAASDVMVLPDYTTAARLALAQYRAGASRLNPVSEARRHLEALR